jgi:hypothetical protein
MIRPTPGMDGTQGGVLQRLLDDAQVLALHQNHPDHVAIKPLMHALVQKRRCMDSNVE